ncbi:hypothetical protein LNTAR_00670 [Lentisphaera araneosa HTCC2155]|uniref:PPi-type phosphoenolpyruvate carboxykinase lobe 2 domain-containing protein n=1 Tax=Lentisphaera araneosa HTCC2155 TaxID=313628 RepID=A6DKH1_9BACT|nr:hypothetical protein [Lentisphaera araneosa]EDM27869.1 hypothetical protein LNTAR_00670 [Lentisphaera araneosa HTCC2155]
MKDLDQARLQTGTRPTFRDRDQLVKYLNLRLSLLGEPTTLDREDMGIAHNIINNIQARKRFSKTELSPVDTRIQNYINALVGADKVSLPAATYSLDIYGMARELSLPPDAKDYKTPYVNSVRIKQGVLHNPKNDRRTTKGVFHIVEGDIPVPFDKKEVPLPIFEKMLYHSFNDVPNELMRIPFTSDLEKPAHAFTSLLLRPLVVPDVPGFTSAKSLEIRFFAPAGLVSSLDFVESIFGNGGDPYQAENDAALDPDTWTGHTGCVILAPQLLTLTKKELGLPKAADATERQKRDGMCWEKEDELYNDGQPFKICSRNKEGQVITIITDNYFGYCKKEVKTQISYSANLFGLAEEEHAGGALSLPRYHLASQISASVLNKDPEATFEKMMEALGDNAEHKKLGYAIDKNFPNIHYLPNDAYFDLSSQTVTWGDQLSIPIAENAHYVLPNGYKVSLEQHPYTDSWRLVGTEAEGTLCHKPCTVSGGGKSEISKSLSNATFAGPVFVNDFDEDMKLVNEIIERNYRGRFKDSGPSDPMSRPILSPERSLGSVIKLLTPLSKYSESYNTWLRSVPGYIKAIVFMVKRFYREEWGQDWQPHYSVDQVNGENGHELKCDNRKLTGIYLRVAQNNDGSWRTFKLRQDFLPSYKIQWEDDISASAIIPSDALEGLNPDYNNPSIKIAENCEYRFFQRPDDAIIRGFDHEAEADLASDNLFVCNFEPLAAETAKEMLEHSIHLSEYTDEMKNNIREAAEGDNYFVASDAPRIVNGAPSKNPRYLQTRGDLYCQEPHYLAEVAARIARQLKPEQALYNPVNAVLPGRRNNPAEPGIRPLAVYSPLHYQELPELFMDFICSLTGKSPSTTGAGSEGALTKGPFNCLPATADLNNALLSYILTGYQGFSSAAGYIGTRYKLDHDISLIVPEIWSRLTPKERSAEYLIKNSYLEKIDDFEHKGELVQASRLGYRITKEFTTRFMGKIFDNPHTIFPADMLRPELQSAEDFVDGINNIVENQTLIAKRFINEGSAETAIPPLKALVHIMAFGEYEGMKVSDTEFRELFSREKVIASDWYQARIEAKVAKDEKTRLQSIAYLKKKLQKPNVREDIRLSVEARLKALEVKPKKKDQINKYMGTLGADPICL